MRNLQCVICMLMPVGQESYCHDFIAPDKRFFPPSWLNDFRFIFIFQFVFFVFEDIMLFCTKTKNRNKKMDIKVWSEIEGWFSTKTKQMFERKTLGVDVICWCNTSNDAKLIKNRFIWVKQSLNIGFYLSNVVHQRRASRKQIISNVPWQPIE